MSTFYSVGTMRDVIALVKCNFRERYLCGLPTYIPICTIIYVYVYIIHILLFLIIMICVVIFPVESELDLILKKV